MSQERKDRWRATTYIPALFLGEIKDPYIKKYLDDRIPPELQNQGFSINSIIDSCRELIYDKTDGQHIFHCVTYSIDSVTLRMCLGCILSISCENLNDALGILAFGQLQEVPVLPNRPDLEDELLTLYAQLYERGFETELEGGKKNVRFHPNFAATSMRCCAIPWLVIS